MPRTSYDDLHNTLAALQLATGVAPGRLGIEHSNGRHRVILWKDVDGQPAHREVSPSLSLGELQEWIWAAIRGAHLLREEGKPDEKVTEICAEIARAETEHKRIKLIGFGWEGTEGIGGDGEELEPFDALTASDDEINDEFESLSQQEHEELLLSFDDLDDKALNENQGYLDGLAFALKIVRGS